MNAVAVLKRVCRLPQLLTQVRSRQLSDNASRPSSIVFRSRSAYDYHEDKTALNGLLQRNGTTDQFHLSPTAGNKLSSRFYLEFTDSLGYMHSYPESYCHYLLDSTNGHIVAMHVMNFKRVYSGAYLMTVGFERLLRVDVNRRREGLATILHERTVEWAQYVAPDYIQNYTLSDNTSSLKMQRSWADEHRKLCHLDLYLVPAEPDATRTEIHQLTAEQTERLCMVDMVKWINRPVLSDLRRILQLKEYRGTFCVGDFRSGRYAAASVWQPSTGVVCRERPDDEEPHRSPIYFVFNLFQSPSVTSESNNEMQRLLSAIGSMAAKNGVSDIVCCVEQSSPFKALCEQQASAMTTFVMFQYTVSSRSKGLEDVFHKAPVWHDPRDLS